MRALILVLALLLFMPLAAAEEWGLRAGGATVGPRYGVTGLMLSDDTGAGIRYWFNATEGGMPVVAMTICYGPPSHTLEFCARQSLHA